MRTQETLRETFSEDPKSWKLWGIYCRREDPRVVVPTRLRWTGWTVNLAHWPKALVVIAASILLGSGPTLLLIYATRLDPQIPAILAVQFLSILLIVVFARRMANPFQTKRSG